MASHEAPDVRHIPSSSSLVSVSWFTAAALAGWAGCGFSSTAPGTNAKDAGVDGQGIDGPVGPPPDAAPGVTCYGPAGWQVCFTAMPTGNVTLPGKLNTDGGAPCLAAPPMGWSAPQPAACFIVGDTITVPGVGTDVTGNKPLVLVANRLITITGVLDVASKGALPSECQSFSKDPGPADIGVGGGGGAGGSFMTRAGNGGKGDGDSQNGQASQADPAAPIHLRGGCPGQAGGAFAVADAGKLGVGGGSVYLLSGGEIALQGAINASGAAGGGGNKASGGNGAAGGGGGGSGGMIVLYAATITVPAPPAPAPVLMANGGGGGGGGSPSSRGADGSDPSVTSPVLPANGGDNGGQGYPAILNALDGTSGASGTGGGGGGGGGAAGYIRSNKPLTPLTGVVTASPPVSVIP